VGGIAIAKPRQSMQRKLTEKYDAVIVGSGPNGLAAAVELARAGLSTLVVEAKSSPGGGARTEELTLPGFQHDVCSTVHPLGVGSPFFRTLGLENFGLEWLESPAPLAHVIDENSVVTLERSLDATAEQLGADGQAYKALLAPLVDQFDELMQMLLGPLRLPSSPILFARFGLSGLRSINRLILQHFHTTAAAALLAGVAAHATLPLHAMGTSAFALVLAAAGHRVGWPIARGGSHTITRALVTRLRGLGGDLVLDRPIRRMADLPAARAYVFDITPKQLLSIVGNALPSGYRRRLERFRYGPGVFKMDWALRTAIPWTNAACTRASTVHLSGNLENVDYAEARVHEGGTSNVPFTLVVQPSRFDPTRAPKGFHTAWAYCHVPNGSQVDMARRIEEHIERYAPGFRESIIGRSSRDSHAMEAHNANYIGGDINGGTSDLGQLFFRPVMRLDPYATPSPNVFICSSSTPPGGGVHGMCGYWAARSVLRRAFGFKHSAG
jgi:phytoene dehydrogenase-like protein